MQVCIIHSVLISADTSGGNWKQKIWFWYRPSVILILIGKKLKKDGKDKENNFNCVIQFQHPVLST